MCLERSGKKEEKKTKKGVLKFSNNSPMTGTNDAHHFVHYYILGLVRP